ncbi:hypothetical protein DMN91_004570 [Ooceraea biroi]|uniref:MADF domain-containing protein n=2 Tax=Ooceraea biroi TaxID=2015173 RepID=A0A3L8DPX8_OOCBI|nr:uncharacterized protein LOC105283782 [Ooceraea biroi]RLU22292.1 hypothetical protein DMN91_004570 [Ooceraea biroi]
MCEEICEKIEGHQCLEGYNNVYIDRNYYFYPALDDRKTIIRQSMMPDNTENIVLDNEENVNPNIPKPVRATEKTTEVSARNVRSNKLTNLEVEILIIEVQKRTPLWDFSLPLEQRSRETVQRLWDEVSRELNGKLNVAKVKKKFKSLRDTYRKIIQGQQHASSSARIDPKDPKKWKYYVMNFLRDSCLIRPTQTNVTWDSVNEGSREDEIISDVDMSNDVDRDADEDCSLASASIYTRKKRSRTNIAKESEETISAINRIADAMCTEEPNIVIPPLPASDEVDSMLHATGLQLRRMPYQRRM